MDTPTVNIQISITLDGSADPAQFGAQLAAIVHGAQSLIQPTAKNGAESVETGARDESYRPQPPRQTLAPPRQPSKPPARRRASRRRRQRRS